MRTRQTSGRSTKPISERRLTAEVARFAACDQAFAHAFVMLVLDVARKASNDAGSHARLLKNPLGTITCTPERPAGLRFGAKGRCDLWFQAPGNPPFTLGVEVKLNDDYQWDQRERYLEELARPEAGRAGLVVVTARSHRDAPTRVLADKRWLGEIRWGQLGEKGLSQIQFEPQNGNLQAEWVELVDVLLQDRYLGVLSVDPDRFSLWATDRATPKTATLFLEETWAQAKHFLDEALRPHGLNSESRLATDSGDRVHLRGRREVYLSFLLGRPTPEIDLCLTQAHGDDRVRMKVWFYPRRAQSDLCGVADGEVRATFAFNKASTGWVREFKLEPVESGTALRSTVLKNWRLSLRALGRLGAFDLPASRPGVGRTLPDRP